MAFSCCVVAGSIIQTQGMKTNTIPPSNSFEKRKRRKKNEEKKTNRSDKRILQERLPSRNSIPKTVAPWQLWTRKRKKDQQQFHFFFLSLLLPCTSPRCQDIRNDGKLFRSFIMHDVKKKQKTNGARKKTQKIYKEASNRNRWWDGDWIISSFGQKKGEKKHKLDEKGGRMTHSLTSHRW